MEIQKLRIIVTGKVQGVGFRQFTAGAAQTYQISGKVRNLPDGSVECYAMADKITMQKFLQKLQKGPSMSRVDSMNIEPVQVAFDDSFKITY
jgi:acylphosphatase